MFRSNRSALAVALLLSCGYVAAQAQTPAKPATGKPATAASAGGATLDGSAPSATSKVLTINELRECMKRQDELKPRGAELEQRRVSLDQDRVKIEQQTAAILTQKEEVARRNEAVKAFNVRMEAYGAQVSSWNERMAELKDSVGMLADRKRKELNNEQVVLQKAEAANRAEGEKLMSDLQEAVNQVNARVTAQQQMSTDWNNRNAKLNEEAQAYEDSRVDWRADCGNRRYREDDEKALRSGK